MNLFFLLLKKYISKIIILSADFAYLFLSLNFNIFNYLSIHIVLYHNYTQLREL